MHITKQQEEFSRAFVHAVIAVAGYQLGQPLLVDDDSVDLSISTRGPVGSVRSPRIDAQLKSHGGEVTADPWTFPLKVKNYDDLRHTDYQAPRILIVVIMPKEVDDWLSQTEEQLVLRRCGYWVSLRGLPSTANTSTVSVSIPRGNVLTPEALRAIMQRVGAGGVP